MHILPAVRKLEEKYANEMVVIGVHAGKFIAERETDNIRTATRRLDVPHPVVNDRHFRTWRAFQVQAWPTIVLVSPDGNYIGQHAGEITFDMIDPILEAVVEVYSESGMLDRTPVHFLHCSAAGTVDLVRAARALPARPGTAQRLASALSRQGAGRSGWQPPVHRGYGP